MAEKSQNDKMAATPVTVAAHQKPERKSYLEVGPIAKRAIFGQKSPKNAVLLSWGLRFARYWKSDSEFWKFRFFHYNKVVLVLGFLAEIRKTRKSAKNGQKKPKWENGTRSCGCCYPWKNQEEKFFRGELHRQNSHFWPKNAQKMPFCSPESSV